MLQQKSREHPGGSVEGNGERNGDGAYGQWEGGVWWEKMGGRGGVEGT